MTPVLCVKCKKEIPEGSVFCPWCGRKQTATQKKTRRRARGTGTIRKDTRYSSQWIAIAPPTSKGTNGKYIGSFRTQKEAQQALEDFINNSRPQLYNITLSKIYDLWSEKHFETLKSEDGRAGYKAAFADLAPLHSRKMSELKTADFQFCVDSVAEKFSRSKCEKVKQLCSQLCKYAMQNDVMDKNYAQFIVLPKEEKKEKTIFTQEEIDLLWKNSNDKRIQIILFMIYTGFRIREVVSIRRENIHLDEGYIIAGVKTEAGTDRVVPLPPSIPEIKGFVELWLTENTDSEYLLDISANSLRNYQFYPALASLGMIDQPVYNPKSRKYEYHNPRITPHSTRHTFASLSAEAGMKPENLQKIIGHASYQTTADIYVHKNIAALTEDMGKLKK